MVNTTCVRPMVVNYKTRATHETCHRTPIHYGSFIVLVKVGKFIKFVKSGKWRPLQFLIAHCKSFMYTKKDPIWHLEQMRGTFHVSQIKLKPITWHKQFTKIRCKPFIRNSSNAICFKFFRCCDLQYQIPCESQQKCVNHNYHHPNLFNFFV